MKNPEPQTMNKLPFNPTYLCGGQEQDDIGKTVWNLPKKWQRNLNSSIIVDILKKNDLKTFLPIVTKPNWTNQWWELVILMPFFDHHKTHSSRHSHNVINTRREARWCQLLPAWRKSAMTTTLESRHKKSLLTTSWNFVFGRTFWRMSRVLQPGDVRVALWGTLWSQAQIIFVTLMDLWASNTLKSDLHISYSMSYFHYLARWILSQLCINVYFKRGDNNIVRLQLLYM